MYHDTCDNQHLPKCQSSNTDSKPDKKSARIMLGLLLVLGLSVSVVVAAGAVPRMQQQQGLRVTHSAIMNELPQVLVTSARRANRSSALVLPGELQAIEDVPVYAQANGYMLKRFVDIGDKVKAGQLLAIIDTPETDQGVDEAKAALSTAKANLDGAIADKANYTAQLAASEGAIEKCNAGLEFSAIQIKRYSALLKEGAVSAEQRDEMLMNYKSDSAALATAKQEKLAHAAQLAAACTRVDAAQHTVEQDQAQLKQMQTRQRFQKIVAPFDGVITARLADPGSLVVAGGQSAASQILSMAKTNVLRIHVEVPESDYRDIHKGDKIKLRLQEFAGQEFAGEVSMIGGSLNSESRTLPVEILINNDKQILKPGAYAEVCFNHAISNPAIVIPSNAAITRNDGMYVAIVKNNRIQYTPIEISKDCGDNLEISSGLSYGELVVTDSGLTLPAGTRVKAKNIDS